MVQIPPPLFIFKQMFILHYIVPLVVYYFYRNSLAVLGMLIGNAVDLDHVYYRIIGKVGWFQSACPQFGQECSLGFYPLHNFYFAFIFLGLSSLIFAKKDKVKFFGWVAFGAFLNLFLDFIAQVTGFNL